MSAMGNGSGDYVIAFSTVPATRLGSTPAVSSEALSPIFQAVIEATEEAIYNSLLLATTVEGYRGTGEALPLEATREILRRYGVTR